jgi:polysaccharide pyruvyl transferase WcaK-like protein/GT2 family glycosyltransferase
MSRARGWIRRARAAPSQLERLSHDVAGLAATTESLGHEVREGQDTRTISDAVQSVQHLAARVERHSEAIAEAVSANEQVEHAVAEQVRIMQEVVDAPARDAEVHRLVRELGSATELSQGLSIFINTWNYASLISRAIRSAKDVIAALPPALRGRVLVLDDVSADETLEVLAAYRDDPQVEVIVPDRNLGLSRARNVLLARCATTHAFVLDADNTAYPDGVGAIFETARQYGSAFTYGNVLASTDDDAEWLVKSYEPPGPHLFSGNYVDSMAVIDVAAVRALGGYTLDPELSAVDDYDLVMRCCRRGLLVGYVPIAVGRYRRAPSSYSASIRDLGPAVARIRRKYLDDVPDVDTWCVFASYPGVGVLWASPATRDRFGDAFGDRADEPPKVSRLRPARGPRVLLVAPGGVRNLGDDAISEAVLDRIRDAVSSARVETISDMAHAPTGRGMPAPWIGTVREAWQGLTNNEIGATLVDATRHVRDRLEPPSHGPRLVDPSAFDLAVFAGGGNLTTQWRASHLVPRAALAFALAGHGVPTIWSGQGIGPLDGDDIELIAMAAERASAFGTRDGGSRLLLPEAVRDHVDLVGDDSFGRGATPAASLAAARARAEIPAGPIVVFHARSADYAGTSERDTLRPIARAVDALAAERGSTVVGLALNGQDPAEAVVLAQLAQADERQAQWRIIDARDDASLAAAVLADATAAIVHSYHAALWALERSTPALLVAHTPYYAMKAAGLSAFVGASVELSDHDFDAGVLNRRLLALLPHLERAPFASIVSQVDTWLATAIDRALGSTTAWRSLATDG